MRNDDFQFTVQISRELYEKANRLRNGRAWRLVVEGALQNLIDQYPEPGTKGKTPAPVVEASAAFEVATGAGQTLWPSQREAYAAGFMEKAARILRGRRLK